VFRLEPPKRYEPGDLNALCAALQAVLKHPVQTTALEDLSKDESGAGSYVPHVVVYPESTAEVAAVLRLAAERKVPVTPRGAGSGKSGGALAVHGGILLSTVRMQRLVEISKGDNLVVAEPGLILGELQRAVLAEGRYYPPDPASADWCSVGGTVAENAAGPRSFKYGTTRDYVLGMTCVLMGGEVLRVGRRTQKGVAGYDLASLLCGSEGTLAVMTELTLALVPRPVQTETALLGFSNVAAAARAVVRIVDAGILPATLELLDPMALSVVKAPMLDAQVQACLLVELEGAGDLLSEIDRCAQVAQAGSCVIAADDAQRRKIWDVRKGVSLALKQRFDHKVSEDIVVPPSQIPKMIEAVERIAASESLAHATYGHAGDGNLHTNYLWNGATDEARIDRALAATYRAAVALGGTITGEHGVGLVKREFLALEQAPPVISLQRRLKAAFDPLGLLNPGKLLPEERQAMLQGTHV
jgi:glycolate oxidase